MKVYFEGANDFSYGIKKTEFYLKKYAPKEVTFTTNLQEADYQISHFISHIDRTRVPYRDKNYCVLYYCRDGWDEATYRDTLDFFKKAKFVWTYADFNELYPEHEATFVSSPLGVDSNLYTINNLPRKYNILTTGHVSASEAIYECLESSIRKNKSAIHLGGNLVNELGNYLERNKNLCTHLSGLSDEQVASLLNQCNWVSALRRDEGFEFMNLEGTLCGARPICFNMNCYTKWFEDIPIYIPPYSGEELIQYLMGFMDNIKPITEIERNRFVEKFSWEVIAKGLWNKIMDTRG